MAKRPESGLRGPPVHQLFNAIQSAADYKEEEFLMTSDAVKSGKDRKSQNTYS